MQLIKTPLGILNCLFSSTYFVHGGWFPEDTYILDNVDAIRHIPATIVQGRYDVTCTMKTAWELHQVSDWMLYSVIWNSNDCHWQTCTDFSVSVIAIKKGNKS